MGKYEKQWDQIIKTGILHSGYINYQVKDQILNIINDNLSTLDETLINYISHHKCYLIAATFCTDPNTLKQLDNMMNTRPKYGDYSDELYKFVVRNPNLNVVRHIIETYGWKNYNKEPDDRLKSIALRNACLYNPNLNVIKYLIEEHQIDPRQKFKNGLTCLQFACEHNQNLDIIKYLINDQKIDPLHVNDSGYYCFILACKGNKNVEIIRYLANYQIKNNINDKIFEYACNNSPDVCKFIIEETEIDFTNYLKSRRMDPDAWYQIFIKLTKNYNRIKKFLNEFTGSQTIKQFKNFINIINPFLFCQDYRGIFFHESSDPFKLKFCDFKRLVDESDWQIDQNLDSDQEVLEQEINTHTININDDECDFTKPSEILFEYNNQKYYGNRQIVYDQIECFSQIENIISYDEIIKLNGQAPAYVINMWIKSMYGSSKAKGWNDFDITKIKIVDIEQFMYLIEQYETRCINVRSLEINIIKYFTSHQEFDPNADKNLWLIDFCQRNQMKHLYIYLHNTMIRE